MSEFIRYNSIENSYRTKFIDKIQAEGHSGGLWAVKEKLHGANFSIHCILKEDGEFDIKVAKRSGYIKEGENFHQGQLVGIKYAETLMTMFQEIGCLESLSVYGEIFGGEYPHKDVPNNNNVRKVQKGVYYGPDIYFMAFDLKVDGKIVPTKNADALFKQYKIGFLPNLFVGTMKECLEHADNFQTTIPAMLGLPSIEGNIAEGIVIKPYETVPFLYDRSRVILKKKNDKFKEVQSKPKVKVQKDPLPQEVELLLNKAHTYCTLQRVANVVSKMGALEMSDFPKVLKETNLDAMEEFKKDHEAEFNVLDHKYQKLVSKKMGSYNAQEVKAYFRENV